MTNWVSADGEEEQRPRRASSAKEDTAGGQLLARAQGELNSSGRFDLLDRINGRWEPGRKRGELRAKGEKPKEDGGSRSVFLGH